MSIEKVCLLFTISVSAVTRAIVGGGHARVTNSAKRRSLGALRSRTLLSTHDITRRTRRPSGSRGRFKRFRFLLWSARSGTVRCGPLFPIVEMHKVLPPVGGGRNPVRRSPEPRRKENAVPNTWVSQNSILVNISAPTYRKTDVKIRLLLEVGGKSIYS